jgi:hypothetical protein
MSTTEVVEGELVPEVYTEPPPAPITLFGTADPELALKRMREIAAVLVDVIKDRKLYARISGHEHITAEGWTTLGGMLGVVPVVEWTRPLEEGNGWEARVEAKTLDGRVVGAAESMCSRTENTWKTRDDYALRSMAQTRAIGRALRAPLGQIVVLAGYEPASAEEIPRSEPETPGGPIPDTAKPTQGQLDEIRALLRSLDGIDPDTDWKQRSRELAGVPGNKLTRGGAGYLIDQLRKQLSAYTAADERQEGERQ